MIRNVLNLIVLLFGHKKPRAREYQRGRYVIPRPGMSVAEMMKEHQKVLDAQEAREPHLKKRY